jgi:hypothetical protein
VQKPFPSYVQSQFRDKIEEETKTFNKFRDDIGRQQANIYADEKIFIALLEMYLRDKHTMFDLGTKAVGEIDQSEALNAANMIELKKILIDGIQNMAKQSLMPDGYKKLRSEILQKNAANVLYKFDEIREIFHIYPHVWALQYTLRRSIDRFAAKETTDDEAKSIMFNEYEISFYSVYRREFDLFGEDTFSHLSLNWSTLLPSADYLFLTLNPSGKAFESWREKQKKAEP